MENQPVMELNLVLLAALGNIAALFSAWLNCYVSNLTVWLILSMKTPPGTKILLTNSIKLCNGFLLLEPKNFRVLGGNVSELVEEWKIQQVWT